MAKTTIPTSGLWSAIAGLLNGNFNDLYDDSGWGHYIDTEYTDVSPLAIAANTPITLPNNGGTKLEQEVSTDYSFGYYDPNTGKILGGGGDSFLITVNFKIQRNNGSGNYDIKTWIDIGGDFTELYHRTIGVRGSEINAMSFTTTAYSAATWAANGGVIKIESQVASTIHDIEFSIHKLHTGRGTY